MGVCDVQGFPEFVIGSQNAITIQTNNQVTAWSSLYRRYINHCHTKSATMPRGMCAKQPALQCTRRYQQHSRRERTLRRQGPPFFFRCLLRLYSQPYAARFVRA